MGSVTGEPNVGGSRAGWIRSNVAWWSACKGDVERCARGDIAASGEVRFLSKLTGRSTAIRRRWVGKAYHS